ncbi:MAG: hypothetical protein QXJ17_08400 [Nitrososphaeria archaeon]
MNVGVVVEAGAGLVKYHTAPPTAATATAPAPTKINLLRSIFFSDMNRFYIKGLFKSLLVIKVSN